MKLTDLTGRAGEWLRGSGPMHDVVISSRMRLARNVAGYPFLTKCSAGQRAELADMLRERVMGARVAGEMFYVDVESASALDRQLLMERHLISRHQAEAEGARGVVISGSETVAVMVNEEDHLRIQVLRSGLQLADCFAEIERIDDALEAQVPYVFHGRFGYLTACPTNVGTGMRVSVMMHLPALKMSGEIDKVIRAAHDMRLAVRGLHGEGTDALGDFFQLSNQSTLGRSEQAIIDDFKDVVIPQIIEYEHQARQSLLTRRRSAMDDKIYRALGILRSARMISSEETMGLLSLVRLGIHVGRIDEVKLQTVNELFLLTQPAHLQRTFGWEMDAGERSVRRAEFIRKRLSAE